MPGGRFPLQTGAFPVSPPASAGSQPLSDVAQALRTRHAGARVLLVEDNFVNRDVAVAMLQGTGLAVDTAADGLEAVARARAGRYALVLMDVYMPGMDGLEATRAIRALPGWGGVPVLALSANAFVEDRQACSAAGMDDFLAKPVDMELLYRTLLRWLDGPGGAPAAAMG
jgi:CheY-like chemotaxis protein